MGKLFKPLLIVGIIAGVVLLQFGFIFLLVALLPSVMAYFVDSSPEKSTFKTVLACNFAATLPSIVKLINTSSQFKYQSLSSHLTNPETWLIIYGGAAAGWCLVYLCRFIARFILIILYEYRIASLERFQKKLLEEWGEQIKHPPL